MKCSHTDEMEFRTSIAERVTASGVHGSLI